METGKVIKDGYCIGDKTYRYFSGITENYAFVSENEEEPWALLNFKTGELSKERFDRIQYAHIESAPYYYCLVHDQDYIVMVNTESGRICSPYQSGVGYWAAMGR